MRIGGVGNAYPTYVYNPNVLSSKSMNKLSRISDDVLDKKVDYSETVKQEENQNPLKKGQTIDFEGILARQMQQGQKRAAQIMPNGLAPVEEEAAERQTAQTTETKKSNAQSADTDAASAEKMTESSAGNAANTASDNNTTVMQMQKAIQAYEMFMTA